MSPPLQKELSIIMDTDDGIPELSPELAQILAEAQKQTANSMGRPKDGPSSSVKVDLRVRLLPHPEDESGRVQLFNYDMQRVSWSFRPFR